MIGSSEKAPGPSQTQGNKQPLSLTPSPVPHSLHLTCGFTCSGTRGHVGLAAIRAQGRLWEAETLDPGFRSGLAEDMVGLSSWRDGWRWETGNPRGNFDFHTKRPSCHTTTSRAWVLGMLSHDPAAEPDFCPPQLHSCVHSAILCPGRQIIEIFVFVFFPTCLFSPPDCEPSCLSHFFIPMALH